MGICSKKFIWSNLQVLLLKESLLDWYVVFANLYMVLNSLPGLVLDSSVVKEFGMTCSEADHSVFYRHSNVGCIYLVVYVDDIVLTGSYHYDISQLKRAYLSPFSDKRSW